MRTDYQITRLRQFHLPFYRTVFKAVSSLLKCNHPLLLPITKREERRRVS